MAHRFYTVDGKKYPSVTSICSVVDKGPGLAIWMAKLGLEKADKVKRESAERGKQLHQLIEGYFTNTPLVPTEESYPYWVGFQKLITEHSITPFCVPKSKTKGELASTSILEQKVTSERYGYAGTLDAIVWIDSAGPYLVDWKTSSNHYDEYRLQTAAYLNAFLESNDDVFVPFRRVYRFTSEGDYEFVDHKLQGEDFADFLHCKALFDRRLRNGSH